jgi:hypothetical protein
MNDKDQALQQFRETLESNARLERGKAELLPPTLALAKCWEWIHGKGATTGSARTLQGVLLSLANEGSAELSALRALDGERRIWVASLIAGLTFLNDIELLSAAGGLES